MKPLSNSTKTPTFTFELSSWPPLTSMQPYTWWGQSPQCSAHWDYLYTCGCRSCSWEFEAWSESPWARGHSSDWTDCRRETSPGRKGSRARYWWARTRCTGAAGTAWLSWAWSRHNRRPGTLASGTCFFGSGCVRFRFRLLWGFTHQLIFHRKRSSFWPLLLLWNI